MSVIICNNKHEQIIKREYREFKEQTLALWGWTILSAWFNIQVPSTTAREILWPHPATQAKYNSTQTKLSFTHCELREKVSATFYQAELIEGGN